ncbi:unnamed protein product [Closterium sp. NIES-53]
MSYLIQHLQLGASVGVPKIRVTLSRVPTSASLPSLLHHCRPPLGPLAPLSRIHHHIPHSLPSPSSLTPDHTFAISLPPPPSLSLTPSPLPSPPPPLHFSLLLHPLSILLFLTRTSPFPSPCPSPCPSQHFPFIHI